MGNISGKQKRMLSVIKQFIKKNHYSPTVRELGKELGYSSSSTVFTHLEKLRKEEYVTWEPSKPRTIKILKEV